MYSILDWERDKMSKDVLVVKEFKHALQFFSPLPQNVKLLWNDGPRLRKIDNELKKFILNDIKLKCGGIQYNSRYAKVYNEQYSRI